MVGQRAEVVFERKKIDERFLKERMKGVHHHLLFSKTLTACPTFSLIFSSFLFDRTSGPQEREREDQENKTEDLAGPFFFFLSVIKTGLQAKEKENPQDVKEACTLIFFLLSSARPSISYNNGVH